MFCSCSWNHGGISLAAVLNLANRNTQNFLKARFRSGTCSLLPHAVDNKGKPKPDWRGAETSSLQWPLTIQPRMAKRMNTRRGKVKDH